MQTEKRDRVHRLLERVEETVVTETEITEETQQDLQKTDRFELHEEAQKTIEQDMSLDVGITVSSKFGPVKSEITSNFATSTSVSESTSSASTYAQEVIDKSLQKIIERVREERTVTTLVEVEETNTHTFDNILGDGHVIGIYRWVDKLYKAQLVDYGKRLFLEFFPPEPAAFYVHTQTAEDLGSMALEMPDEPGSLSPWDITDMTYESWVSKYNVQDVAPPPAPVLVVGLAAEMDYNSKLAKDEPVSTVVKELRCRSATWQAGGLPRRARAYQGRRGDVVPRARRLGAVRQVDHR